MTALPDVSAWRRRDSPGGRPLPPDRATRRTDAILAVAACVLFLLYAGCFLYFFVDDEAIPLVYARNLLRGRGLVYTVLEGRVEGYSDFLHVLWSAMLLRLTNAAGFSPLAPLLIGKAVSLAAGCALIVVAAKTMVRAGLDVSSRVAALAFLALAGPLAVWSASSLETVIVALTILALALAVWDDRLPAAVVLGILLVLERIDAPFYAAAVLLAGLAASPRQWRALVRTGALILLVVVAFHVWRYAYFGTLLSAPLAAKVLYRLQSASHLISKPPDSGYLLRLRAVYGWTGLGIVILSGALALRSARGRAALGMLIVVGLYAERVDDWMFGWRFAVAMAPFMALLLGLGVQRLPRKARALAAAGVCVWSLLAARTFVQTYARDEGRPIFWLAPRAGRPAWLGRYEEIVEAARDLVRPGDRIADNQAGLIPYMLDAENLDDLGICSRFVAMLPTTDVYFTGVGRYSPLTNKPVIRTAHGYLLYHDVRFIVAPADLMVKANGNDIPTEVLGGRYRRVEDTGMRENVLYRRTDAPDEAFARDPSRFSENLAHLSHVVAVTIDGRALGEAEIGPRLPFIRELERSEHFTTSREIAITFARADEEVSAVYIGAMALRQRGTLTLALRDVSGRQTFREDLAAATALSSSYQPVPAGTRAATVVITARSTGDGDNVLLLGDLRVEGQTLALGQYVRTNLRFPAR